MDYSFCKEKLSEICEDFRIATGVPIIIYLRDLGLSVRSEEETSRFCRTVQECNESHRACAESDKELSQKCLLTKRAEHGVCHAGVLNVAVPILFDGSAVGYISTYNLRNERQFSMTNTLKTACLTENTMSALYGELRILDDERLKSIIRLLELLAEYLVHSGLPIVNRDADFSRLQEYIKQNLGKRLTVSDVSRGTNISKSTIYRTVRKHRACTFSEYVNKIRIDKAERLLVSTELSLDEVAQKTGYSSTVYFRSVFKKLKGVSPKKYRTEAKKKR